MNRASSAGTKAQRECAAFIERVVASAFANRQARALVAPAGLGAVPEHLGRGGSPSAARSTSSACYGALSEGGGFVDIPRSVWLLNGG